MSSYKIQKYAPKDIPTEEMRNLVYARWKRSLRYGNDFFRLIFHTDYYAHYQKYIDWVFSHPEAIVRYAILDDDPDIVVIGFSVTRGNILDFVHVPLEQRRNGIGTALIPKDIDTITHLTKTGLSIWGSKYGNWRFNPFI